MSASELLVLLAAICRVESGGNPSAINVHDGGSPSYGECQIKESTAREMGFQGHTSELLKQHVNRFYAYRYLRKQARRYGDKVRTVSAYNSGSVRGEIKNWGYVNKVLGVR